MQSSRILLLAKTFVMVCRLRDSRERYERERVYFLQILEIRERDRERE